LPPHLISPRSILTLSTHICLDLLSGPFPSGFPINNLYVFLFSPIRATCPSPFCPPWLDNSNYAWQRVQVMKLFLMEPSPTSCNSVSL
jgi:hypothetical protein